MIASVACRQPQSHNFIKFFVISEKKKTIEYAKGRFTAFLGSKQAELMHLRCLTGSKHERPPLNACIESRLVEPQFFYILIIPNYLSNFIIQNISSLKFLFGARLVISANGRNRRTDSPVIVYLSILKT